MLLSALSVLVVAQSISEIPEGLMNNPVYICDKHNLSLQETLMMTQTQTPKRACNGQNFKFD